MNTMSTASKIIDDAMSLPEADRSYLAAKLLESLDGGQPDEISPEWREELSRRVREIDEGRATMVPHTQVIANARARVQEVRRSKQSV